MDAEQREAIRSAERSAVERGDLAELARYVHWALDEFERRLSGLEDRLGRAPGRYPARHRHGKIEA